MTHQDVKVELMALGNPEKAVFFKRFFKTGPGQYGEGDVFLGLSVPQQRIVAQKYRLLSADETEKLVQDAYHECRLTGLLIWTNQAKRPGEENRQLIFDYYLRNKHFVNNWDLVDTSCPGIVGNYLLNKDRGILYELARENYLWSQRIAMISTLAFIRKNQFQDTFQIAELLLSHRHDLIHKAVGWMLREVGKKNPDALEEFLHDHAGRFPRTALRYAIERFEPARRKYYLDL
ncbi:DNA alkylation repair protein [Larkinella knui]|uniref:DNA alkylation repair protein n=1 Tax=Larkinella knui TaxID=2025310 RepID=A0A3P1CCT5_9BACT|nr:DNA alkylation repair protein [Larkinella knui]RRB10896.1 DNA alkylation repair protein [Larkinella knui]